MPPKEAKKASAAEPDPREDPEVFLAQYQKFCKRTAVPVCQQIVQTLSDDEQLEDFQKSRQFVVHPNEPLDPDEPRLGPGGARALATSILGTGPQQIPFLLPKSIRIWWSNVGDDGTCALAELLRLGGAEVQISYMELWDNNIGPRGAMALGRSLMVGNNRSLLTLKLDYNRTLGSEGLIALCSGLRTNSSLKQLHVPFCNIGPEAGPAVGEMLTFSRLALTLLNLEGNQLGGQGLLSICQGLMASVTLQELNIADNEIEEVDVEPLQAFGTVLMSSPSLIKVNLMHNRLGVSGAEILVPALGPENHRIQSFLVDQTLPADLFARLYRNASGGKKKGKKGKKGKKKK